MSAADDAVRCQHRSFDGQCQRRAKVRGLCRQHAKIVAAKAKQQETPMPARDGGQDNV